ncbi:MAG: hypothetical protein Q9167_006920 [Letrouitia subvulpina]
MATCTKTILSRASCYGNFHHCIFRAAEAINTLREISAEDVQVKDQDCSICKQPFNEVKKYWIFLKPVQLPCGHTFCKSCIFLWLRPLDNEAPDEEVDFTEPDEDAESETSSEDSLMTEGEDTQPSTNENVSEDSTEEDGNFADPSHDHRMIDEWGWASRVAASCNFVGGKFLSIAQWAILPLVDEYRTSERRKYCSGNNTCPLCRFQLFPKPCCSGSSSVLKSVIRLFDAAYDHLDIALNEDEQRSRRIFVEYLELDNAACEKPRSSPEDLIISRVYTLFEAIRYMRGFIARLGSEDHETYEGELLDELEEFIDALEGKIAYFNLNRDPHFLLRDFQPYDGPSPPRERRNAIC